MKYLSVCSGIEAASCAWGPLGWEPWAFSEIEPFPSAVLAHHYPDVPNLGDMTKFKEWPHAAIDVLVGGTPCQSFSVAGLRKGLDDPRGNLMLTYLAILDKYRPAWMVWENVPGVLSSNRGRDFGTFLGGLAQLGYGFAYRILDAQYAGVPQRRRRVFVVGYLGDWRRAAGVLFERHSLSGNPPPSRETGEGIAATLTRGAESSGRGGYAGRRREDDENLVAHCLRAKANDPHRADAGNYIAHALRGEGFDASEDGTGRGTPLIPTIVGTMKSCKDSGGWSHSADHAAAGYMIPIPFDQTQITSRENRSNPQEGDPSPTLAKGARPPAMAFQESQTGCREYGEAGTLRANGPGHDPVGTRIRQGLMVRRLTPRECERLQGLPDDWTLVPYRGKPAKDGPRYKSIGNSMARPVMAWIGRRIDLVNRIAESAKESAA